MNTTRRPRHIMLLALATASVTIGVGGVAQATPQAPRELPPTTPADETPPAEDTAVDAVAGVPDESDGADAVPTTAAVVVTTTVAPNAPLAPTTTVAPTTTTPSSTTVAPTTTQAPTTTAPANDPNGQSAMLVVPGATAPSAPRSPAATPGNASVGLTWAAPSSNGGAAIDTYAVQRSTSSSGPWTNIAFPKTLSYSATGLSNGTTYYFRIVAHNSAGWSAASTVVSAKPKTVPGAALSPAVTPGNGSAALTWKAPSTNGGATIDTYAVQRSTSPNGPWTNVAFPKTLSYTAAGLTNGTTYYFRIRAHNAAGWGPASLVVSATPRTVPNAPLAPTATASSQAVKLAWVTPYNGGLPIYQYSIQRAPSAAGPWTHRGTATTSLYNDAPVANGQTYYYRIVALNAFGASAPSAVVSARPVGVPTTPRLCKAWQPIPHDGLVWWSHVAPSNDGGSPILEYRVEIRDDAGYIVRQNDWPVDALEGALAVLDPGDDYVLSIRARNQYGYSPACQVTFDVKP